RKKDARQLRLTGGLRVDSRRRCESELNCGTTNDCNRNNEDEPFHSSLRQLEFSSNQRAKKTVKEASWENWRRSIDLRPKAVATTSKLEEKLRGEVRSIPAAS